MNSLWISLLWAIPILATGIYITIKKKNRVIYICSMVLLLVNISQIVVSYLFGLQIQGLLVSASSDSIIWTNTALEIGATILIFIITVYIVLIKKGSR